MKLRTRKLAPSMQSYSYSQKAVYANMAINNLLHTLLVNAGTALELFTFATFSNYLITMASPQDIGNEEETSDNYVVPGPDWLWCLDDCDKLTRFGIEIYACVNAYCRKIT
jgi:hypothetical protein